MCHNFYESRALTKHSTNTELLLAPFQGITDKLYRNIYAKHFNGFDEMYTPFVSGSGSSSISHSKLKDFIPKEENYIATVPQIISNNPREIILFAKTLKDYGYNHLNWNLGCPFARIANKKRGSGLLSYPDELKAILDDVYNEIPLELSVKTRLGYYKEDEIFKALEVFNQYPLKHIILHPRTGKMIYSGEANPIAYLECIPLSKHKLIYNGDIYNILQFEKLSKLISSQTIWMLGRGALMNPFLASEIKGIKYSDEEKREKIRTFHDELFREIENIIKTKSKLIGRMKAVWYYMSGTFADGNNVFKAIKQSKNDKEYIDAVKQAFESGFSNHKQQSDYFKKSLKHIGSLAT